MVFLLLVLLVGQVADVFFSRGMTSNGLMPPGQPTAPQRGLQVLPT
jgi:hypothetical protein